MNEEEFKELYKNVKKEQIIEELYYKCEANKELYIGYERLTNIINELGKYCNEVIEETKSFTNTWDRAEREAIEQVLKKLKELKESKKEV